MKYTNEFYVRGFRAADLKLIVEELKEGNIISSSKLSAGGCLLVAFIGQDTELQCRMEPKGSNVYWPEVSDSFWITNDTRRTLIRMYKKEINAVGQIDIFGKVIRTRRSGSDKKMGKGYEIGIFGIVTEWN